MPPIIGVTPCRSLPDYLESVRRVGGEPRVLDLERDNPSTVVRDLHGVLFTGGGDVDPGRYGAARQTSVSGVDPARDEFEFELVRRGREVSLPILGICRGTQVLNVALGGSLIQHIPEEMPGSAEHSVTVPPCAIAHEVWISRETLLWNLMQEKIADADSCAVNSRHHQAIKRLAPGFSVSATAPDGVIEAIEIQEGAFCLGVQWHPENFWRTGEFRPIFEGFIDACRRTSAAA
jgi:putative glutamine amidotransferase